MKYLTILMIFVTTIACSKANDLQYNIEKEMIENTRVATIIKDELYRVNIILKTPYAEKFAVLTGSNIGKRLRILYNDKVLYSTIIQDSIKSGAITLGSFDSEERAIAFIGNAPFHIEQDSFYFHKKLEHKNIKNLLPIIIVVIIDLSRLGAVTVQ